MIQHVEVGIEAEGPWKGKRFVKVVCEDSDIKQIQDTMMGSLQVRNLVQHGLTQLAQAVKMIGAKK